MGLKVTLYGLDNDANDIELGTIEWNGARWLLQPEGDSLLLQTLRDPIAIESASGFQPLRARDEPEEFLRQLHREFKSAYLRASKAVETSSRPS